MYTICFRTGKCVSSATNNLPPANPEEGGRSRGAVAPYVRMGVTSHVGHQEIGLSLRIPFVRHSPVVHLSWVAVRINYQMLVLNGPARCSLLSSVGLLRNSNLFNAKVNFCVFDLNIEAIRPVCEFRIEANTTLEPNTLE